MEKQEELQKICHEALFENFELSIFDKINNAVDELQRASDIIRSNDETRKIAEGDMLLEDIEKSESRLAGLQNRIEFALMLAVYAGQKNAENNYKFGCADDIWLEKYIKIASSHIFAYDSDNEIDTDTMHEEAARIISKVFE